MKTDVHIYGRVTMVSGCSRSQAAARACPHCQHLTESSAPPTAAQDSEDHEMNQDSPKQMQEEEKESLKAQIRELEQDLAQTKLKMVEAKCRIQVRAENKM